MAAWGSFREARSLPRPRRASLPRPLPRDVRTPGALRLGLLGRRKLGNCRLAGSEGVGMTKPRVEGYRFWWPKRVGLENRYRPFYIRGRDWHIVVSAGPWRRPRLRRRGRWGW